jgi:hypothetical protein
MFDMSSLNPEDRATVRWVILHQASEDGPWFCTWNSGLVVAGTEREKEEEIEAHKALDRGYASGIKTRLVKQTNRVVRTVEDVPAMWENG